MLGIIKIEGKQVGDLTAPNLGDYKEQVHKDKVSPISKNITRGGRER